MKMHALRKELGNGVCISTIPYAGTLELADDEKPGTYVVRYSQTVPRLEAEERRVYFEERNVTEENLRTALERAWRECQARSGRIVRQRMPEAEKPTPDIHVLRGYPSKKPSHKSRKS
ncbi:hypothetical protein HY417_01275 [Candidatus Kaiserbacteria bacterium]|nr:hypothetical protein [Candidatus Kaiserbacteria bacterium]